MRIKRTNIFERAIVIFMRWIVSTFSTPIKLYEGNPLPKNQVSLVEEPLFDVKIRDIDGFTVTARKIEFKPGMHKITFILSQPRLDSWFVGDPLSLEFVAQAGHTYEPRGEYVHRYFWRGYIVDKTDGERIVADINEVHEKAERISRGEISLEDILSNFSDS